MYYFGGKSRIAKHLAKIIEPIAKERGCYVEPFIGGASVMTHMTSVDNRIGSDLNQPLITMWRALADGWMPPEHVSEDDYQTIKQKLDENDPMTAFAGFGCSYAGKWFGGYARDNNGRNYAANAVHSLCKKMVNLKNVEWRSLDYREVDYPPNSVIYCDPPYQGTTKYNGVSEFDGDSFWQFCRDKTKEGHLVFISEYNAPNDFTECLRIQTKLDIRSNGDSSRIEKLFQYNIS